MFRSPVPPITQNELNPISLYLVLHWTTQLGPCHAEYDNIPQCGSSYRSGLANHVKDHVFYQIKLKYVFSKPPM